MNHYSIVKKKLDEEKNSQETPKKAANQDEAGRQQDAYIVLTFFLRQEPYISKHDESDAISIFWELSLSLYLLI